MRGGGTKLGTIPNKDRPICLDLTHLLSRTGMVHTGVDRVEWAYLEWCLSLDRPVYAVVRSAFGYFLLDRTGMVFAHQHLKTADWGKTDLLSQFAFKLSPTRRAAEASLRKRAFARATPSRIGVMLRRSFPEGVAYLNTGHSNLSKRVFRAFSALKDAKTGVLIHDLIPLDWPDYQRAGTVATFEVHERNYSLVDAYGADEAFLTGTFGAQTPVGEIDGKLIGDGSRPVTARIRTLYKELVEVHTAQ